MCVAASNIAKLMLLCWIVKVRNVDIRGFGIRFKK